MKHHSSRRQFLSASVSAAMVMAAGPVSRAVAAQYPSKPTKLVVAFAAGGPIDLAARVIAESLSKKFDQPFIVENRPGANGAIAADYVRSAKPDGHTMLISNSSMITITPTLRDNLSYNVERDFEPVTRIAASPLILVVNPNNPDTKDIYTVDDLVQAAKADPEKFSYGSAGLNGNIQQLSFELFGLSADISLLPIPYKGSSEVQVALLSETISLSFDTLTAIPYIKDDKLRPLAVSSLERLPQLPDVPTMDELGYSDFNTGFWSGVFMPKNTPSDIVQTISDAIVEACNQEDVKKRLEPAGLTVASDPGTFKAYIQQETETLANVIKEAQIDSI